MKYTGTPGNTEGCYGAGIITVLLDQNQQGLHRFQPPLDCTHLPRKAISSGMHLTLALLKVRVTTMRSAAEYAKTFWHSVACAGAQNGFMHAGYDTQVYMTGVHTLCDAEGGCCADAQDSHVQNSTEHPLSTWPNHCSRSLVHSGFVSGLKGIVDKRLAAPLVWVPG
eukprot:1156151-Pelagomonas_calceolata.AAC.2